MFTVCVSCLSADPVTGTTHQLALGDLLKYSFSSMVRHFTEGPTLGPPNVVVLHAERRKGVPTIETRLPSLQRIDERAVLHPTTLLVCKKLRTMFRSPRITGDLVLPPLLRPTGSVRRRDRLLVGRVVGFPSRLSLGGREVAIEVCAITGETPRTSTIRSTLVLYELVQRFGGMALETGLRRGTFNQLDLTKLRDACSRTIRPNSGLVYPRLLSHLLVRHRADQNMPPFGDQDTVTGDTWLLYLLPRLLVSSVCWSVRLEVSLHVLSTTLDALTTLGLEGDFRLGFVAFGAGFHSRSVHDHIVKRQTIDNVDVAGLLITGKVK